MTRPLNFLHVTTFYPPYSFGGDAMQIYRLSHALGDLGHHVDVIHCEDSYHLLHPAEPPLQFADHPNVVRHGLRSGFGRLSPLLSQQTGQPWLKLGAISELMKSRNYDVIHFHNISLFGPGVLGIEAQNNRTVKVYTSHEHWLICPTHVLWKFGRAPCDSPQCLRCVVHAKKPPQIWRYTGFLEKMAAHVDKFLAPSRFTAQMHADRGFPYPFAHLPNFIDRVDDELEHPAPGPQQAPYFLFVGRLEKIKGPQTLIALWDEVPEADLLLAGAGGYEAELRSMAVHNPKVKFLGPLPQQELGALYYHAIACLVPSITYETFGMTCIEAFARKTPVIARDLGPLPELIEASGGGLVFNTDEQLLAAIHSIARSPQLRAELGQKGYDGFLQWWCRDAHLRSYFGFLEEAAQRKFGCVPWINE
ncbi:MAG: glycosyltransferase family 4 protein [Terracidiphilus sp.]